MIVAEPPTHESDFVSIDSGLIWAREHEKCAHAQHRAAAVMAMTLTPAYAPIVTAVNAATMSSTKLASVGDAFITMPRMPYRRRRLVTPISRCLVMVEDSPHYWSLLFVDTA